MIIMINNIKQTNPPGAGSGPDGAENYTAYDYPHSSSGKTSSLSQKSFLQDHNNEVLKEIYAAMVHYMSTAKASRMPKDVIKVNVRTLAKNYNGMLDAANRRFFSKELRK